MSVDRDDKGCNCGGAGAVNLHQISSIVRDIREQPCLNNSPIKGNKMLKPEKWQTTFDTDGRVLGFKKALKLIVLGGVDPSIRAEVWEFLLGCYALSSTAEHRRQLRMARRSVPLYLPLNLSLANAVRSIFEKEISTWEKFRDLIKHCQSMHSSIGTGTLAYVGSKVMDVRTLSKDNGNHEAEVERKRASQESTTNMEPDHAHDLKNHCTDSPDARQRESSSSSVDRALKNHCTNSLDACQRESSSDSADLVSVRGSTDSAPNDFSDALPSSAPYNCFSSKSQREMHELQCVDEHYFDFPPLPVTNLFQTNNADDVECQMNDERKSAERRFRLEGESMHSFQINNNVELIMESNTLPSDGEIEMFSSNVQGQEEESTNLEYKSEMAGRQRISDVQEATLTNTISSHGATAVEEKVSEWLWTLHRIVVDVVRTDSNLEFYEDAKNMARMSDILAVYAWVDPATGYCQGMSDLLSPFVVLYEDNADAFWCFEMLIRRMRENFKIEGPTGVMKQLQSLWRILEQTDAEMFRHFSVIGAESLHFAFPMLLVLFRRELSFSEVLRMWEMMWAADFDESATHELEESCLESLVLHLPEDSSSGGLEESVENDKVIKKCMENDKVIKTGVEDDKVIKKIVESDKVIKKGVESDKVIKKGVVDDKVIKKGMESDKVIKKGVVDDKVIKKSVEDDKVIKKSVEDDKVIKKSVEDDKIIKKSMENDKVIKKSAENDKRNSKSTQSEDGGNGDYSPTDNSGMGSVSSYPFCGLGRASFWARHPHDRVQVCTIISSRNGDELPVFCAAAILIDNRHKIIKETHSIDDLIKMFNDKMLKIHVRRCVRTAIKLRKKYFCKIMKQTSLVSSERGHA